MKRSPPALIPFIEVFVTYGPDIDPAVGEFLDAQLVEFDVLFSGLTIDQVRSEFLSPDCPWRLGEPCNPGESPSIH